ncbi:MAG: nucleotidyltransferase domain-containing protein [Candidatus Thorarchaeota archaeon]|jgi:predicted nucleotidyltransferase
MAKKPETLHEKRAIVYDDDHWSSFAKLRERAIEVMQTLDSSGIQSFVYGSTARGDIGKSSDVDIIVPYPVSSYRIEISAGQGIRRELVQATPSMVLKGHIVLDEKTTVTFPLFKLRPREEEFYRWGGRADIGQLEAQIRVPGVDKRLVLIRPTEDGHTEQGVIGYEYDAAKAVGVNVETARERVRVLTRRDSVGRTGVYLTRVLEEDESFEAVAKSLRDSDPALRRTIEKRERSR